MSSWETRACRWLRARPQQYGFMVLDAFSSDAIPIHLMTSEAMALYLSRLAPGGALAFHISNRHLALAPVLARVALNHGLVIRLQQHSASQTISHGPLSSEWMVMARNDGRSRIAGDRHAMDHAGDSFVDAAVDRRLLQHRQRPEPQSALTTLTTKTRRTRRRTKKK